MLALTAAQALHVAQASEALVPQLQPTASDTSAALWTSMLLSRHHYTPTNLDDAMSGKIFDRFLLSIDADSAFFTQADIDNFSASRTKLDDAIKNENLNIPFLIFNRFAQRATERYSYTRNEIKKVPDFTIRESIEIRASSRSRPSSESALQERWRKSIKYDWLQLRLVGATDAEIPAILSIRNDRAMEVVRNFRHGDVLQLLLNAYGGSVDGHTSFTTPSVISDQEPEAAPRFGVGLSLNLKNGFITVHDIVEHGPAAKSNAINKGDRLIGAGQGDGAPIESLLGHSVTETVKLMRGLRNSALVLDLLPVGAGLSGKHQRVRLVREPVEMPVAIDYTISPEHNGKPRRVGIIKLRSFYRDFEALKQGNNFGSSTKDVARLLQKAKDSKIDSVILDLRDNQGGSLEEAIAIARLFIGKGPMGEDVKADGTVNIGKETPFADFTPWDGLVGVLVNRRTAAGAEITAAAIQDYGRGLIIGENTFGLGTVHAMIDFDRRAPNKPKQYGDLKVTVSQFFRVNGKGLQIRGINPDISFPVSIDASAIGESLLDNAVPWTQRTPLDFTPRGDLSKMVPKLQLKHATRIRTSAGLQKIQELARRFAESDKAKTVSLNESELRKELNEAESKLNNSIDIAGEQSFDSAVVEEAARILIDEADLLHGDTELANQVRPGSAIPAGVR